MAPDTTDPLAATVAELMERRLLHYRNDIRAFLDIGDVVSASVYADIVLHLVGKLTIQEMNKK